MASQGVKMDQFEAYFKRADLDGDGRISGAEAVAFLQGSNLPKQVLAQIWTFADQSRSGFLTRPEFYNALRLVTVAQSKRDLTPDIVKAALYGPAAGKIPPPQISVSSSPAQQINALAAASAPQIGAAGSQSVGFRGPGLENQQPQFGAQAMPGGFRPAQGVSGTQFGGLGRGAGKFSQPMPRPVQSMAAAPGVPSANVPASWLGGSAGGASAGFGGVNMSSTGVSLQQQTAVMSQPQSLALVPAQPAVTDAKKSVSGNGFGSDSFFGGDAFSAALSTGKQEPSAGSKLASSISLPVTSAGPKPPVKSGSLDSLQSAYATQPLGGQIPRAHSAQSLPTVTPQGSSPSSSPLASVGVSVGGGGGVGATPDNSQSMWPKMKPSDIQKYTKVFLEVDTDRDGRITGEQARNLFLSWRLPREILKQVWDLADQDSDSMLSLREFCFALYLMERFREGRPLPTALPSNVMYDETLLSMTSQPKVGYGNSAWGPGSGMGFGEQPGIGPRPIIPAAGLRPPVPLPAGSTQVDGIMAPGQQKARGPALEDSFLNQHDADQNSVMQEGTPSDKKVNETEKIILDSKEKIEYYRNKMQDLVLYKSRCDNRLNEIIERAIADKRESELLGKKYEEKYKQVAESASKLTIEEATFRDIQARKSELHQAIVNMERGGSADGILQVRADRIQSDLDELMKVLTERCKKHNLEIKSAALIELPIGWQPGIQEGAAVWDEDWDKFEDEGFSNELSVDVNDSAKSKTAASQNGNASPDSLSNGDVKSGIFSNTDHVLESESAYTHSEDELARSPQDSPAGRTALDGASPGFSDVFAKSTEADTETHRSFDDSTWGAFDTNDDVDSVWGFNPAKDTDSDKHRDFFGSDDFGVKPIRTESPSTESIYQKKSPFFEDSVPATPLSRFGNSPRYSEAGDHYDNFSRFDSFSVQEGGFSPRENLTRFDSINSTKDFGHSRAFSSFDDSDPFGSSGPFKVSSDDQTPKKSGSWSAF